MLGNSNVQFQSFTHTHNYLPPVSIHNLKYFSPTPNLLIPFSFWAFGTFQCPELCLRLREIQEWSGCPVSFQKRGWGKSPHPLIQAHCLFLITVQKSFLSHGLCRVTGEMSFSRLNLAFVNTLSYVTHPKDLNGMVLTKIHLWSFRHLCIFFLNLIISLFPNQESCTV